jgi:alanine racemase
VLTLYVDEGRWWSHLRSVVDAVPGLVPVVKGNGYGFGRTRLAEVSEQLGADTLAVGTYSEIADVAPRFSGDLLVLTPWREFEPTEHGARIVHTVSRLEDLPALVAGSPAEERPRVVLELMTSMRRHGFDARSLRAAAKALDGVAVEGFALHLPMAHGSHMSEMRGLMNDLVASGIDSRRVYVSHLTDGEMAALRSSYGDFELRPRIGTRLWLGDRGALRVRSTILDSHEVDRGDVFGYRGRTAPKHGHIVVVSGGTAHGIGLEAPTGGATLKDRAARIAKGGLDAAGFVRSPFTIAGKQRLFAEPPHMQASMLFVPNGTELPPTGAEVEVRVRFTATTFDRIVFT